MPTVPGPFYVHDPTSVNNQIIVTRPMYRVRENPTPESLIPSPTTSPPSNIIKTQVKGMGTEQVIITTNTNLTFTYF